MALARHSRNGKLNHMERRERKGEGLLLWLVVLGGTTDAHG